MLIIFGFIIFISSLISFRYSWRVGIDTGRPDELITTRNRKNSMAQDSKTVLVLGAGFTRALIPESLLMEDHYPIEPILEKFKGFDRTRRILKAELNKNPEQYGTCLNHRRRYND